MKPALNYMQSFFFYCIDQPVFICNTSAPKASQVTFEESNLVVDTYTLVFRVSFRPEEAFSITFSFFPLFSSGFAGV